jgi:hypothetical protein
MVCSVSVPVPIFTAGSTFPVPHCAAVVVTGWIDNVRFVSVLIVVGLGSGRGQAGWELVTLLRGRDSETLGPRRVATALAADRRHGVQPVLKSLILDLVGARGPSGLLSGADRGLRLSERDHHRSPPLAAIAAAGCSAVACGCLCSSLVSSGRRGPTPAGDGGVVMRSPVVGPRGAAPTGRGVPIATIGRHPAMSSIRLSTARQVSIAGMTQPSSAPGDRTPRPDSSGGCHAYVAQSYPRH